MCQALTTFSGYYHVFAPACKAKYILKNVATINTNKAKMYMKESDQNYHTY